MTIREARKNKGLTLMKLSELSGVSYKQLQEAETGKINPCNMTAKNLLAIAKALGVSPYELLEVRHEN